MTAHALSSETIHATAVAHDGLAVLIMGPSGSGKSDLALRLIDRGFRLVSDDQTIVSRKGDTLVATAPQTISGKLEIRGVGIVEMEALEHVPVALVVDLTTEFDRLPDDHRQRNILGVPLRMVTIDAKTASAAAKVVIALNEIGRSH